ncbi:MAG TPA: porin [Thiobacillaceae bacterium]|nr:porin [Thiobacillaceae bacterium]
MKLRLVCLALGTFVPMSSHAANWVDVLGTEPADSPIVKPFGFVQPVYTNFNADPLSGMKGAASSANGKDQIQNLVQPTFENTDQFQVFRAQFGLRGRLTDKINYFLLTDVGQNLTTVQHPVMVTDASMTFSYIPGAKIRAGLFKLPTGEEALVSNPLAFSYVYYSAVTSALVQESFFQDVSGTPAGCTALSGAATLDCGKVVAGNNAFRDWGIEVFDSFRKNKWELGYAAMVSNGNEIENLSDNNSSKDLTGRVQLSYVFGGKGALREDANVFVWHQSGDRTYGGKDYDRMREGLGFRVTKNPIRVSGEYIRADGMVASGPNPPVLPASGNLEPPYDLNLAPKGKANGWYLESGWRFLPDWEIEARYDEFDRNSNDAAAERLFKTWTLGAQYFFYKNTRLTFNYEWRTAEVPNPLAITNATQRSNANVVTDNLADRVSLQLTWYF